MHHRRLYSVEGLKRSKATICCTCLKMMNEINQTAIERTEKVKNELVHLVSPHRWAGERKTALLIEEFSLQLHFLICNSTLEFRWTITVLTKQQLAENRERWINGNLVQESTVFFSCLMQFWQNKHVSECTIMHWTALRLEIDAMRGNVRSTTFTFSNYHTKQSMSTTETMEWSITDYNNFLVKHFKVMVQFLHSKWSRY